MTIVPTTQAVLMLVLLLGAAACSGPTGHDHGAHDQHEGNGHDDRGHGAEEDGPEPVRVTRFSETLELFMEHPPLVKGQKAPFLVHLTVLETGEPVSTGKLMVELTKPGAKPLVITIDAPKRDGLYVPVLEFGSATLYRARFRVEGPQINGVVDAGELLVHADEQTAKQRAGTSGEAPHDAIPFLMEQQWKINLKLAQAEQVSMSERLIVPATIEPAPGGEVAVSLAVPGRLKRTSSGLFLAPGREVTKGETLAVLELSPETANRVRQARVKRDFSRRAFDRISQIRAKGVGSEQQYEQAKQELELAEAEYRSLLGSSQAMLAESGSSKAVAEGEGSSIAIVAPLSGEIVSAKHRVGAYVAANEELFRLLNNDLVWIEARVSEFDIAKIARPTEASFALDAYPERQFDLSASGGRFVNLGSRIDPDSRTVPVRYELPNPEGTLKVGMFGTAQISVETPSPRLAIPEAAVIYENGVPTAYALLTGESFQKRELKLGVREGGFVEVLEGLEPGEWVVAEEAYALKLAAASPAAFGHGHAH